MGDFLQSVEPVPCRRHHIPTNFADDVRAAEPARTDRTCPWVCESHATRHRWQAASTRDRCASYLRNTAGGHDIRHISRGGPRPHEILSGLSLDGLPAVVTPAAVRNLSVAVRVEEIPWRLRTFAGPAAAAIRCSQSDGLAARVWRGRHAGVMVPAGKTSGNFDGA